MSLVNPVAELNKTIPIFSLVEPSEMQELVPLLRPVNLETGQVLFREKTPGDGMWILGDGAEVSISQKRGKRPLVIAYNRAGETVGEMALIDGGPRSGAAVVTQGGPAYHISALSFKALRDAYRPAAFMVLRQICKELCSRVRATTDRVAPSKAQPTDGTHLLPVGRRATEAEVDEFAPFQSLPKVVKLALCQKLRPIEIGSAQAIYSEGEQGEDAYFLLSGEATLVRNGKIMHQLRPGAMFGMVSVIDEGRRSASCVADGSARLLQLNKRDFDTLFRAGNRFAFQMVDLVARQLVGLLRATNQLVIGTGEEDSGEEMLGESQSDGSPAPEMLPLELEIELSFEEALRP